MQVGIICADRAEVALEVSDINVVETDDGGVKPHVSLGELVANHVVLAVQNLLKAVERFKEWDNIALVCLLTCSESRLVHTCNERRSVID